MARSTKQDATPTVTVTDDQYTWLLQQRLDAKHAYEENENEDERAELLVQYNQARSAVRKARKVRKAEAAELQALRDAETAKQQKRSAAAKKAAETRKAKAAAKSDPVPDSDTRDYDGNEPEDESVLDIDHAEAAA